MDTNKITGNIGQGRCGPGRPKGARNRATTSVRQAVALLADANIDRVQLWLDDVAEKDGSLAALKIYLEILEFSVPKIQRQSWVSPDPPWMLSEFG